MVSIKVKFKPGTPGAEGIIYYQIRLSGKTRCLKTCFSLFPDEWDSRSSKVIVKENRQRKPHVISVEKRIHDDMEILSGIIRDMDSRHLIYDADDIISAFNNYVAKYSIFKFMTDIITQLRATGKDRTAETYTSTLNSFSKFRNGKDLMLYSLTSDIMESYQSWLQKRGIIPNSISFYIRILRATYNKAVNQGIIPDRCPFKHVYTGIDKTEKRAISISLIKRIMSLNLPPYSPADYARDMFMMSFYLRGMSFVDMAFLLKSDLKNSFLTYRRRKTGKRLTIKWTKEMQRIIDKYPENPTRYLLPIIKESGIRERSAYRNISYKINLHLKKIAEKAGIKTTLTLYCARHSWASAAKAKGIPLSIISDGMGHNSETTTRIYLDSLDTTRVDRANSLIINSL